MICSKCEIDKPETKFYRRPHNKPGRRGVCKECQSLRQKICRAANAEKIKTYQKTYRTANLEQRKLSNKAYRFANIEKIKVEQRIHRLANTEKNKVRHRAYRIANPESARIAGRKRRALKNGTGHEPYTDTYIFERDNWICGICRKKIDKRLKYPHLRSKSIDHIIALSKGGADAPINLQPAHLRCNMSKHARGGGQLRLIS